MTLDREEATTPKAEPSKANKMVWTGSRTFRSGGKPPLFFSIVCRQCCLVALQTNNLEGRYRGSISAAGSQPASGRRTLLRLGSLTAAASCHRARASAIAGIVIHRCCVRYFVLVVCRLLDQKISITDQERNQCKGSDGDNAVIGRGRMVRKPVADRSSVADSLSPDKCSHDNERRHERGTQDAELLLLCHLCFALFTANATYSGS